MSKGGAKPDYLDMDKDGNKTESMKSALKSKMRKGGKRQMGGMAQQQAGQPAASFIEPPMEQPFSSKSEFVAQSGGERMKTLKKDQKEERKTARKNRRTDRKADRTAVKTLKKSSRKTRNAKPFKDGAGPIVEMSRGEKREDRKATNKAGREFKKQERKARRTSRKELKAGQKGARQEQRGQNKIGRDEQKNKKVNTLNNSDSSSVKPVIKKKVVKPDPVVQEETTTTVEKKKGTNRGPVSFGQAFKENKAKGKKEFSWKGKKYHTRTKDEEAKSNKKTTPKKTKTKTYTPPKKTIDDISGVNVLGMQHGPKYKKGGYMRRGGKK